MFFLKPNITEDVHMIRDRGSVNVLCEDVARVWGNMAEMLMAIRTKIVVMTIFPVPFFISIRLDNSLYSDCMVDFVADFAALVGAGVLVSIRIVATPTDR